MPDKYNPEVGEIWWFGTNRKHYFFYSKEEAPKEYSSYKWRYKIYCVETGDYETLLHGNMNAYGEGWFRKVSPC